MYKIKVNPHENRLYLFFSGYIDVDESKRVIRDLENRAKELKPGFDIINDLRYLKKTSLPAALNVKHGVKLLRKYGSNRAVRVVGGSKFAIFLFAKYSEFTTKGKVFYVPTMDKALEILNEKEVQMSN